MRRARDVARAATGSANDPGERRRGIQRHATEERTSSNGESDTAWAREAASGRCVVRDFPAWVSFRVRRVCVRVLLQTWGREGSVTVR